MNTTSGSSAWISGLVTPSIAQDVASLTAQGTLTYGGALQILDDVAKAVSASGSLSAAQFSDLETIAANLNNGITTSDDVVSLFTQAVDGSPANATWTAGAASSVALGNLQAGSSVIRLDQLIEKWFLGADLPTATGEGATSNSTITPTYQAFTSLPLFANGGVPAVGDINQGDVGDCELCAGLIEQVINHPTEIEQMFTNEGNGIYAVRFYVGGKPLWVTVNDELPVYQGQLLYNEGPALWGDLVEKAYAQLAATGLITQPAVNAYDSINGDAAYEVMENLDNAADVQYYYSNNQNWNGFKSVFIAAIAAKDDVILESNGATFDAAGNQQLINDHAFAVIGYDSASGDFIVRNPWGNEGAGQNYDTQFEVSMANIVTVSGDIVIDNSSNPNVIITSLGQIASQGQSNALGEFTAVGQYVTAGSTIAVSSLFSSMDLAGLPITQVMLQAIGSGSLQLNGASNLASAAQQAAGDVVVSMADLAKLTYVAATTTGDSDLLVSATDGVAWSTPNDIALTITAMPAVVIPALTLVAAPSASLAVANLFKVSGLPGGDISYQLSVENGAASLALNGAANLLFHAAADQAQVSAADLSLVTLTAPSEAPADNFDQLFLDVTVYQGANPVSNLIQVPITVGTGVAAALSAFDSNEISFALAITDDAATVAASLDTLQTMLSAGDIQSITLTDGGIPTLSISAAQASTDAGALGAIAGTFSVAQTASGSSQTIQGVATALGNTVIFNGAASQFTLTATGDGVHLTVADAGMTDQLSDIQALQFSDVTEIVAPEPGSNGDVTGGNITELYGAVFGRVPDVAGLTYYENELAANPGLSLVALAEDFLQSPEYTGNSTHIYAQSANGEAQFITDSYDNLLHRAPESAAIPYYQNLIGLFTAGLVPGTTAYAAADLQAHATVLVDFSASTEFLGDVQVTAAHPASSGFTGHWLVLI